MTMNNISTSGGLISTSYQIIDNIVSKQCYQYKQCTNRWLTHIDPCTSGLTRNTGGELSWFNGQQFPDGLMKPTKRKAPWRRFPYVKKKQHHHHHYQHHHHKHRPSKDFQHLQQNMNDESDTDMSANVFDSSDSDDEVCTWPP